MRNITRRSFIVGGTATAAAAALAAGFSGCNNNNQLDTTKSGLKFANFETNGVKTLNTGLDNTNTCEVPTKLYTITNNKGAELCVTNFGARIVSLLVPDKNGDLKDVVLGFDNIKNYADFNNAPNNFHGAIVGRYANRINKGQVKIDGKTYQLDTNEKGNLLHGGKHGIHFQTFDVVSYDKNSNIKLELNSPDGEMGFPGNLKLQITYTLNDNNTLGVYYEATSSAPTVVNFSNHAYWDVDGNIDSPSTEDLLFISSKQTTPVNNELIPTGQISDTNENSPFDFFGKNAEYYKKGKRMGADLNVSNEQLSYGKGYDHNFVILNNEEAQKAGIDFDGKFQISDDGSKNLNTQAHIVAKAESPSSGIVMTIVSTQPGLQFFDCHDMGDLPAGKNNKKFPKYAALVLEPQNWPDSPNHQNFPNTILRPGETFTSKTEYQFTTNY